MRTRLGFRVLRGGLSGPFLGDGLATGRQGAGLTTATAASMGRPVLKRGVGPASTRTTVCSGITPTKGLARGSLKVAAVLGNSVSVVKLYY